ncbi:MAG: cyclic nucleotide-binding domain-containing protein [Syntrophales bacterium]|jgi:CRP-like cAMP-binding protein|nr:cyclic nucleotide-binding domain-containing protein [Syntrophales bacterium]MDD4338609.1 cyclic nucleotide-binding domain-containing protein [Syntrophales bacterium]HOG07722.1 cyclic nucleotide-binding domain-containing protein [Syntrophales bacterium]HOS78083.1 cyclic nucleotide-binding domain-containing protein [Syntrophales bacterium]HQN26632.1 cyclic nucleotide-binding domain-containing protein [Syntrophales bacterium]
MATLTLTPLTNILEGVAFFQGFASEELDLLLDVGKWTQVAPHERIVQQGEQDLHMYVLVQGQAEVIYNEKVVATIKSGDIFGEIGLMGRPRIAHVESSRECLLLAFDANDLNKLPLTLQVKFLRRVLDTVFARLQKSNAQRWLTSRDKTKKDKTRTLDSKP